MLLPDLQVSRDRSVHPVLISILLPYRKIRRDIDPLHAVQRNDIKVADRPVILGRIARRDKDESFRHSVRPEHLVLQELEHCRCEGLGHTVDLVEEQDAFPDPRALDLVIDGGDDLAHRIFRDRVLFSPIALPCDEGKTDRTLPRVVRDRVGDEIYVHFLRDLPHDGCLADPGRSDEEDRPLPLRRDHIGAELVLLQVGADGAYDFFFCCFDIHVSSFHEILSYRQLFSCRQFLSYR